MPRRIQLSTFAIVLLALGLLAALSSIMPWVDGSGLSQMQAAAPFVILLCGIGLIVTAFARKWLVIPFFVLAAIIWSLPLFAPGQQAPPLDHAPVTVMSFNLHVSKAPMTALADKVVRENVDVAVLTEMNPAYAKQFADLLTPKGYRYAATSNFGGVQGTSIVTRLPFRPVTPQPPSSTHEQPAVDLNVRDTWVRLRAVHPLSPVDNATTWYKELGDVKRWASEQPADMPLILAGDFNASTMHPIYRSLAADFDDASPRLGVVWEPTWPVGVEYPAFTAIDHVLIRRGVASDSTSFVLGSDHKGVIATVYAKTR